ncbi:MAG TPA: HAMP domain-containing histidine kinase [Alcaligenaceae bacterium]|nr:HAMP domain-containing histidine kinase [Alcaligenaceae bacterium]
MKSSLITRLTRTLFFFIAISTAVSLLIVERFVEDVEDTILHLELKADAQFFTEQLRKETFQPIKTARLEAIFLPDGEDESSLATHFKHRDLPFTEEIEVGKTTLLVYGEQLKQPKGKLFLAQDITIMENRELLVQLTLIAVAGLMLLIGYFIARAGARYLARPFRQLTHEVLNTIPGSSMRQIDTNYRDQEFSDIAEAFNRFLSALEQHIEREKLFVKLASHELRTPLAVMGGALNVLEQRQSLSAADQKTLKRLRRAWQTMRDDSEVLLELARSETVTGGLSFIVLEEVVKSTIDDLLDEQPEHVGRITIENESSNIAIRSHMVLVRMLMRNLLQNALRHTRSAVEVTITDKSISIRDFGAGLPPKVIQHLKVDGQSERLSFQSQEDSSTTFGLLIVRLVCERLAWELEVVESGSQGTVFNVLYQSAGSP